MDYDVVDTRQLSQIMARLHRILKVRITFFDMQEGEWNEIAAGGLSSYCELRRKDPDFEKLCLGCDHSHLLQAKEKKEIHVYHCHNGLIEGIIPLYDQNKAYLGSIVFGQIHDVNQPPPRFDDVSHAKAYQQLHQLSLEDAIDIAELLKSVSESIIQNELLIKRQSSWASMIKKFISNNLHRTIGNADLAAAIDRSPSFISHHFRKEFGESPQKYIEAVKMKKAMKDIEKGIAIKSISHSLGYYDEFHFSKTFKKYWGKSPKSFK